uniref:Small nuclear RNA activating complex, polypeptide 2 n=1 Tax=Oreochromis niloticus TaxID=8128 RepID=A0A669DZE0_ORENI
MCAAFRSGYYRLCQNRCHNDTGHRYPSLTRTVFSLLQIQSVVELLKNKVLLNARLKLKKQRREERNVRKPIEEWTYMASSLVGTLEQTISTAFSQMLIVSSTEPCTLRNGDPPQLLQPPLCIILGRSVIKTTQQPTEPQPATIAITSTSESLSSSLNVPVSCSATTLTSVPGSVLSTVASASSAISSCSSATTLPQSVSATAFHAKFGRTSKHATKDSPRTFGVKCVVDFERIYGFLSTIQKPSQDCQLTPMESAIVLDLLMSLPEELPLLDCNKLHKHMIQVRPAAYTQPSSSCDQALKALVPQDHQSPTGTTDSTNVTGGEGKESQIHKADSQSTQSSTTFSKLDYSNVTPPQLNPFIVPLTLLKRR